MIPVAYEKCAIRAAALITLLACSGCVVLWEDYTTVRVPASFETVSTYSNRNSGVFGGESEVRDTVATVKTIGQVSEVSRHAIRLPNKPMQSITTFEYEIPAACGGHRFRVYEAGSTQILEYAYVPDAGNSFTIRDYVSGPNPFIRAGLWSAYDHTDESIGDMRFQFAKRGTRLLKGTYSQGLVTGLDPTSRRALGSAYDRALSDSLSCGS